ncbi:MAG: helix-hairpin-helix domain-containing protein [Fimbriimonadaceae bacterium]
MNWIAALGIGGILGWGLEFLIDRFYWRAQGPKAGQGDNPFKADMAALRTRFDDVQAKLEATRSENDNLLCEVAALRTGDVSHVVQELSQAKAKIAQLEQEGRADPQVIQELVEARAKIASLSTLSIADSSDLAEKLKAAEAELDAYRSVEEITKIEMADLRRRASAMPVPVPMPAADLTQLKDDLLAKEVRIGELQAQLASIADSTQLVESKDTQIRTLTSQLESSREMIRRLEDRLFSEKSETNVDDGMLQRRAEVAEARVHELQAEINNLRSDLENTKFNLDTRERQIASATVMADLEHLQGLADSAEQSKRELQAQLDEARRLLAETQAKGDSDEVPALQAQLADTNERLKGALIAADRAASQARQIADLEEQLNVARSAYTSLNAELNEFKEKDSKKSALKQDIEDLTSKLQEREALIAELRAAADSTQPLQQSLDEARSENAHQSDLIENLRRQLAETDDQATLLQHSSTRIAELEAKLATVSKELGELNQLRASLEHHRTALARVIGEVNSLNQGFAPVSEPSHSKPDLVTPMPLPVHAPEPAAAVPERDPLEQINGIGFVYERKLWDAGILTFADLANATPEEVRKAIMPEPWQHIEPAEWIAEAAQRAAGA